MEKSKIYTRSGDEGYTSLAGGSRAPKTHPRIEAYGTIDELNSFVACLLDETDDKETREMLTITQNNLFTVGGYLATESDNKHKCQLAPEETARLERFMDASDAKLPPLHSFILPGGCRASSMANVCRTVCRRAERRVYQLNEQYEIDANVLKYLNRLSDFFFILGRQENFKKNVEERVWMY